MTYCERFYSVVGPVQYCSLFNKHALRFFDDLLYKFVDRLSLLGVFVNVRRILVNLLGAFVNVRRILVNLLGAFANLKQILVKILGVFVNLRRILVNMS